MEIQTKNLICDECGKEKPDVKIRLNPYLDEIRNIQEYLPLCDDCEQEIANGI